MRTTKANDLHREWMHKPSYRRAYEALEKEYARLTKRLGSRWRQGADAAPKTKRPARQ